MYAVIQAGGHQYRVSEGDKLLIDRMPGDAGAKVTFDQVLMLGGGKLVIGKPFVTGAAVHATIMNHQRGEKILVMHYRRRKNHKKTRGHRQPYTMVEINKIQA